MAERADLDDARGLWDLLDTGLPCTDGDVQCVLLFRDFFREPGASGGAQFVGAQLLASDGVSSARAAVSATSASASAAAAAARVLEVDHARLCDALRSLCDDFPEMLRTRPVHILAQLAAAVSMLRAAALRDAERRPPPSQATAASQQQPPSQFPPRRPRNGGDVGDARAVARALLARAVSRVRILNVRPLVGLGEIKSSLVGQLIAVRGARALLPLSRHRRRAAEPSSSTLIDGVGAHLEPTTSVVGPPPLSRPPPGARHGRADVACQAARAPRPVRVPALRRERARRVPGRKVRPARLMRRPELQGARRVVPLAVAARSVSSSVSCVAGAARSLALASVWVKHFRMK